MEVPKFLFPLLESDGAGIRSTAGRRRRRLGLAYAVR
jgi:hypothetical protein